MKLLRRLLAYLFFWPIPRKCDPAGHHWRAFGYINRQVYYECQRCHCFASECPDCWADRQSPSILGRMECERCGGEGLVLMGDD